MGKHLVIGLAALLLWTGNARAVPIVPPASSIAEVNCGSGISANNGAGERYIECGNFNIYANAETIGFSTTVNPGFMTVGSALTTMDLTGSGQIGGTEAVIEYYLAVDPGASGATSVSIDIDIRHAVVLSRSNVSNGSASGAAETQIGLNGFGALLYDQRTESAFLRADFSDTFRYDLGIDDVLAFRATASCAATNLFGPSDVFCNVLSDPIFTIVDPDIAAQASLVFSDNLPAVVPVPAAFYLMISGFGFLGVVLKRSRNSGMRIPASPVSS